MATITFEGEPLVCAEGETVLNTLISAGKTVPYSCMAGVCQTCLMVSDKGEAVASAQVGLSPSQKALNQFLACQCVAKSDMTVKLAHSKDEPVTGQVVEKTWLNAQVLRLRVTAPLRYQPGQYVNLSDGNKLTRSYSLASQPSDPWLEFHIRHYPDGVFSTWLVNGLNEGDGIQVQGPIGNCIYVAETEQPLLLMATGTGLAPLWGILNQALAAGHQGAITLVLAATQADEFYYRRELQDLLAAHAHLRAHWLVQETAEQKSDPSSPYSVQQADVYQFVKQQFPELNGHKIYLCGAKTFVNKLRKQCFFAGAAVRDIETDIFLQAGSL